MSRAIVLAAVLCVAVPESSRGADHAPSAPAKAAPPASSAQPTSAALPMSIAAPAQLMRDVRALEDRMALGDEQAFRRRVELIRGAAVSLRIVPADAWSEARNWRALLAYALGGGDVRLVKDLSAKGELKEVEKGLLKGVIALAEAREDDALKELDSAAQLNPFSTEPLLIRSTILQLEGDRRAALAAAADATERAPRNWAAWVVLAEARRAAADPAEARSAVRRATELNPRAPQLQDK